MIQKETKLRVIDNCGAKLVKCIKIFGKKYGYCGFIIVAAIKKSILRKRVRKGMVCKAVIVRTSYNSNRIGGYNIKYKENAVVILKKNELVPLGTRVLGSVSYKIREYGFLKIVSLATTLV